jgi:hypothetical protein
MRQSPYINPTVKTFEVDKSDLPSPYSRLRAKNSGAGASGQPAPGGGGIVPPPKNNFILLEDGFFLLQEDDNKIII